MLTATVILCNLVITKGRVTTQHRGIEKLHCAKSPNRFKKNNSCKITLISQLGSTLYLWRRSIWDSFKVIAMKNLKY